MNPVRLSLRYPQVTIALTVMLVACGVYALLRMPRREDPKIHVRTGIVAAFYPGASAAEVENQVTQKVEQRLFKIEGVRRQKTYSTSMNGAMFVNVELEDGLQDTEKFWSKLRLDMAELKATELPDGVMGPVVDYDFGDTVAVLMADSLRIEGQANRRTERGDRSNRLTRSSLAVCCNPGSGHEGASGPQHDTYCRVCSNRARKTAD
jgi:multidrug efflux pump subunit AcrB